MSVTDDGGKRRKGIVRAVLAGGIVLGVGAAVTLATWNDSEYAEGTFTAGQFDMQGSANPGDTSPTWDDHDSANGAATLGFSVDASSLAPGDTVYAPFAVRLAAGTTNGATVAVNADSTTGTVSNLTYTLVQTASATCDADAVSGATATLVAANTDVGQPTTPSATTFALAKGADSSTAGDPAYLCFAVTAGDDLAQGQTGTATWRFEATSE